MEFICDGCAAARPFANDEDAESGEGYGRFCKALLDEKFPQLYHTLST